MSLFTNVSREVKSDVAFDGCTNVPIDRNVNILCANKFPIDMHLQENMALRLTLSPVITKNICGVLSGTDFKHSTI